MLTKLVPTAPAIANAVYDAIGVRIRDLPITPEKIVAALGEKWVSTSLQFSGSSVRGRFR